MLEIKGLKLEQNEGALKKLQSQTDFVSSPKELISSFSVPEIHIFSRFFSFNSKFSASPISNQRGTRFTFLLDKEM